MAYKMLITTDHKWKEFKCRDDVPEKVLKDQFDWLDEDTWNNFIQYRGYWYHLSEFEKGGNDIPSGHGGWDGLKSDSFFSGVLVKLSKDCETYLIATYTC